MAPPHPVFPSCCSSPLSIFISLSLALSLSLPLSRSHSFAPPMEFSLFFNSQAKDLKAVACTFTAPM